jgi:hypothetical protein
MPWTELGPATRKGGGGDWDYSGRVPVCRRERWDARFRNSISKPPRKGKQTVGSATGIARSNLNPADSAFNRKKPAFDRGRFKTGHRLDYTDYRLDDYDDNDDYDDKRLDDLKPTTRIPARTCLPCARGQSAGAS